MCFATRRGRLRGFSLVVLSLLFTCFVTWFHPLTARKSNEVQGIGLLTNVFFSTKKEAHVAACETLSTWSKDFSQRSQTTERDIRIDDHPVVLDEPKDHSVAEYHIAVLETTDEPQRQRIPQTRRSEASSPTGDHVVVNYGAKEPEHRPRTIDHEVAQTE